MITNLIELIKERKIDLEIIDELLKIEIETGAAGFVESATEFLEEKSKCGYNNNLKQLFNIKVEDKISFYLVEYLYASLYMKIKINKVNRDGNEKVEIILSYEDYDCEGLLLEHVLHLDDINDEYIYEISGPRKINGKKIINIDYRKMYDEQPTNFGLFFTITKGNELLKSVRVENFNRVEHNVITLIGFTYNETLKEVRNQFDSRNKVFERVLDVVSNYNIDPDKIVSEALTRKSKEFYDYRINYFNDQNREFSLKIRLSADSTWTMSHKEIIRK